MTSIIDLRGASGATYRFRLWAEGTAHPPLAGNYACVRLRGEEVEVLGVGDTPDLSRLREDLPKRIREASPGIYTRLNVARSTRTAEHEDLVAVYGPVNARTRA